MVTVLQLPLLPAALGDTVHFRAPVHLHKLLSLLSLPAPLLLATWKIVSEGLNCAPTAKLAHLLLVIIDQ